MTRTVTLIAAAAFAAFGTLSTAHAALAAGQRRRPRPRPRLVRHPAPHLRRHAGLLRGRAARVRTCRRVAEEV